MKRPTTHSYRRPAGSIAAALLCLAALAGSPAIAQDDTGYGFYRTVEGISRLTTLDEAEPIEIERNYPVLGGDRVWVTPGARLEMMLPDGSVIRADGGTDLYFESIALSADAEEAAPTVVRLFSGELQISVEPLAEPLAAARVELWNGTVYLQEPGRYRIRTEEDRSSEVTVREGFAEVALENGSSVVGAGEEVYFERPYERAAIGPAGGLDGLELWGAELEGLARVAQVDGAVDPELAYAAAPLYDSGEWVYVDDRRAWRPRVHSEWRPYTDGWWIYTPSGLTWVASEPWGWVTSHYGSWNWTSYHGWVWYPGTVYSPAWVYWYLGPTHVAWVPSGYYTHFYGPRYGFGFHYGVYGWAGGDWGLWSRWTFCPVRYFGRRHYRAYWRDGQHLGRYDRLRAVPRGVITSDTRAVTPGRWGKPTETIEALMEVKRQRLGSKELADVTPFVARRPELPATVRETIAAKGRPGGLDGDRFRTADGKGITGPGAPWRPERPSAELRFEKEGAYSRDPAVARGLMTTPSRFAGPGRATVDGGKPSLDPRDPYRGDPGRGLAPGRGVDGRGVDGRVPDGKGFDGRGFDGRGFDTPGRDPRAMPTPPTGRIYESAKPLPPSGRLGAGAPSGFDRGGLRSRDGGSPDRTPVVRQILERLRGRSESSGAAPPAAGSGSSVERRPPATSKPSTARPSPPSSSDSGTVRRSSPPPRQSNAKPSPSRRSPPARSGSSRRPAAKKPPG